MEKILELAMQYLRAVNFLDVLDVVIVAVIVYQVLKLVRGTSVESVIKGVVVLLILYFVSEQVGLNVINFVLRNTAQVGMVAVIIVFQPELRRALESLGSSKLTSLLRRTEDETEVRVMIREIVDACSSMSWSRTGALIVFERRKQLDEILTAATELDAKTTSELVKNIFFVKAPLHDGAMIIRQARIKAAGCVLPLTENESLPKELGTRHRAGIGITEKTDAVSVIVSEETGVISVAINGAIRRNLSPETLENLLIYELIEEQEKKGEVVAKTRSLFGLRKGKKS